jgi:hypothetical protein
MYVLKASQYKLPMVWAALHVENVAHVTQHGWVPAAVRVRVYDCVERLCVEAGAKPGSDRPAFRNRAPLDSFQKPRLANVDRLYASR